MLVLVRKQDSNWPRPSRRPSKPPRATFDVPAANKHLQRQPRSYLARSLYHDHLIGAIMAVEIKGSNIIEVAIVAFILAEAGWTAGWPCYLLTHSGRQLQLRRPPIPTHRPPAPPLLPPLPQFPQTLTLDDAIAENCTCEIFSVLLVKPHIYLDVYIATNSKIVSGWQA